jgi:hypothetical protein
MIDGLSKYREKPPRWYWFVVAVLFLSLFVYSSWSSGDEKSQEPLQRVSMESRLIRAIEGLENASKRQARALEDIANELKKQRQKCN